MVSSALWLFNLVRTGIVCPLKVRKTDNQEGFPGKSGKHVVMLMNQSEWSN